MIAEPLSKYPVIETLTNYVSQTQGANFNIGVDCIVYRDGKDSIGWHADDTQGEDRVLSLIVHSEHRRQPRVLKIISNDAKEKNPQVGDEEIWLYPGIGDAYEMDGTMQKSYVHSLPKAQSKYESGRRFALIFRSGEEKVLSGTNCEKVTDLAPSDPVEYKFGPMASELKEGGCYTKDELVAMGAHR